MYSLDEMPTLMDDDADHDAGHETARGDTTISTTLPANAQSCYDVFADVERIPAWVPLVRSVQTLRFDGESRPTRVAFVASMGRASVGYTLDYHYDEGNRAVSWVGAGDSAVTVYGRASFSPLSATASMMHYRLDVDFPASYRQYFESTGYGGHAPSAALNDFRDYVGRAFLI